MHDTNQANSTMQWGYTCPNCKQYVFNGVAHFCYFTPGFTTTTTTTEPRKPRTIEDRLTDIEAMLERLVKKYLDQ